MTTLRSLALAVIVFVGVVPAAHAGTITLFGATFTVTNQGLLDPLDTDGFYKFEVGLNTAGYTTPFAAPAGTTDYLAAFALDFGSAYLVSAFTNPAGWTGDTGQLNNDCASGPDSFLCFEAAAATTLMDGTSSYSFSFNVDFVGDSAHTPPTSLGLEVRVQDTFVHPQSGQTMSRGENANGNVTAVYTPSNGDPLPEPASLLLLGTGLVAAAYRIRQRRGEGRQADSHTP